MTNLLNPELARNLRLELTINRLILTPVTIGVVFLIILLGAENPNRPIYTCSWMFIAVLTLHLLLRCTACVNEELRDNTWDWQRMSSLGAWSMTWGKLLGAPALSLYGVAICLAAQFVFHPPDLSLEQHLLHTANTILGLGILGSIGLISSLNYAARARAGGKRRTGRGSAAFPFLVLLVIMWISSAAGRMIKPSGADVVWYGFHFNGLSFMTASTCAFFLWAVSGAYRLMRAELQYRSVPWVYPAFLIYLSIYLTGFVFTDPAPSITIQYAAASYIPFVIMISAAYIALFLDPKSVVDLRKLVRHFRRKETHLLFTSIPPWLTTVPLLLLTAAAASAARTRYGPANEALSAVPLSLAIFFCRDLMLVHYWALGTRNPARADLAAVFYLALLYGVIPALLSALGLKGLVPVLLPIGKKPGSIIWGLPGLAVAAFLCARRVRRRLGEV